MHTTEAGCGRWRGMEACAALTGTMCPPAPAPPRAFPEGCRDPGMMACVPPPMPRRNFSSSDGARSPATTQAALFITYDEGPASLLRLRLLAHSRTNTANYARSYLAWGGAAEWKIKIKTPTSYTSIHRVYSCTLNSQVEQCGGPVTN